ncbi:MAG: precorrin-6y C5,15-methyltransferase (decarboxylating) subunit CbiE [Desulfobacter sp.]|nr:precorrin-6y C5,15-methyltransferase (decarboxylating) subunit CbiE [Desulfobacter sp.]
MNPVHVIGIGQGLCDLTSDHFKIIEQCDLLIGGQRLIAMFKGQRKETLTVKSNLSAVVLTIQEQMAVKKIVVLASGDPLFYGIGSILCRKIPDKHLCIHPNITSVGAAFSAICQPWQDAKIVSLHSSTDREFSFPSLALETKVAFLTGPEKDPGFIAEKLIEYQLDGFRVCVLENLGHPDKEKISWFTEYKQILEQGFSHPNIVILLKPENKIVSHETYIGMPDAFFRHTKGLITKSEVRSISLSKLKLVKKDHVLWDIGSGSGSVGIEAAIQIPWGQTYAVEKNQDRIPDIIHNIKIFNQPNVKVVHLDFPEGHQSLKSPDRIFIGGGGKDLEKIISCACDRIRPKGVIVINTVIIESMETAMTTLERHGFSPELIQVQISKSKPMPYGRRMNALNPVWIISGTNPLTQKAKK